VKNYAILTRFGHYFEVMAHDEDHAREEAEKDIAAGECPEDGDSIEHIDDIAGLAALIGDIRSDLAGIMTRSTTMSRRLICPYCKYECEVTGEGDVYCGPHRASQGLNTYPKVKMAEKLESTELHPGDCECADCWQSAEAGAKI